MSKKGRANRTSGAPKSTPSVRAVSSTPSEPAIPASSTKARAAAPNEPSEPPGPPSGAKDEKAPAPSVEAEKKGTETRAKPPEAKAADLSGDVPVVPKTAARATGIEAGLEKSAGGASSPPAKETSSPGDVRSESVAEPSATPVDAKPVESTAQSAATDDAKAKRSRKTDAATGKRDEGPAETAAAEVEDGDRASMGLDEEPFFATDVRRSSLPPPIEGDSADDRTVRLREDPSVLARRANSVRIVRYVVIGFGVLLGIGAVAKLREAPPTQPKAPVFVHAEPDRDQGALASAPPSVAVAPAIPASSAATEPLAASDAAVASTDAAVASTDAAAALSVVVDAGAQGDDAGLDAKALKRACQRALDNGKLGVAIENGEASVAVDPTDAEAWLLLGAAYDQKGRSAEARAAYQSCVQKGKRGPVGECAALLR